MNVVSSTIQSMDDVHNVPETNVSFPFSEGSHCFAHLNNDSNTPIDLTQTRISRMPIAIQAQSDCGHTIACLKNGTCSILGSIPEIVNTTAVHFPQAPINDDNVTMQYAVPPCDFNEITQDIQKKIGEQLNAITETCQDTQQKLFDYKSSCIKDGNIRQVCISINAGNERRSIRLHKYLFAQCSVHCSPISGVNKRSREKIEELMESAKELGFNELNELLQKMDDCCAKMMLCIQEWRSSRIIKRSEVPRSCICNVLDSHTISQPQNSDVAQQDASLGLEIQVSVEDGGYGHIHTMTDSSTNGTCSILGSIPETVNATDDNVTMQYAVPPCDFNENRKNIQKEIEGKLDAITKTSQDMKKKLFDCESSCIKNKKIHHSSTLANAGMERRSTMLRKHLFTQYSKHCGSVLCDSKKSLQRIQGLMKSAEEFGLTELNELLKQMEDCCKKIILCIKIWKLSKITKGSEVPESGICNVLNSHTISWSQNSDVAQQDASLDLEIQVSVEDGGYRHIHTMADSSTNGTCSILGSMQFPQAPINDDSVTMQYAAPPCDFNETNRNVELIQRSLYKRNTFPQNLQKELKKKLTIVEKMYKNVKQELFNCKSSYKKNKKIHSICTFMNQGIGNRYTKLYSYIHSYKYDSQYKRIQNDNKRSLINIEKFIAETTKLGLIKLKMSLSKMSFCIKEMQLFHNLIIKENIKTKIESVPSNMCNSNDAYNDNISKNLILFLLRDLAQRYPENLSTIQYIFSLNLQRLGQLNYFCMENLHSISINSKIADMNKIIVMHNSNEKILRYRHVTEKNGVYFVAYLACTTLGERISSVLQCNDDDQLQIIKLACQKSLKRFRTSTQTKLSYIEDVYVKLGECYTFLIQFIEDFLLSSVCLSATITTSKQAYCETTTINHTCQMYDRCL